MISAKTFDVSRFKVFRRELAGEHRAIAGEHRVIAGEHRVIPTAQKNNP